MTLQVPGHFGDQFLIAPVPAPVPLSLHFYQASLFENPHVMGNGGLREFDSFLNVAGAQACLFPKGVPTLFFQRVKDAATGGVGDGVEKWSEVGGSGRHDEKSSRLLRDPRIELRASLLQKGSTLAHSFEARSVWLCHFPVLAASIQHALRRQ